MMGCCRGRYLFIKYMGKVYVILFENSVFMYDLCMVIII